MNVKKLILAGEGVELDFKKTITSYKKIAKTMTAFANTRGGRLLVGVDDKGEITGIQSEEEKFMLDTAGRNFCKPPIQPIFEELWVDHRSVLVAEIPESSQKPHFALGQDDKWWAYLRVNDHSVMASSIRVEVMKQLREKKNILLEITERERQILAHLQQEGGLTFREYCSLAKLNRKKASRLLVNLILMGLVQVKTTEKAEYFSAGLASSK